MLFFQIVVFLNISQEHVSSSSNSNHCLHRLTTDDDNVLWSRRRRRHRRRQQKKTAEDRQRTTTNEENFIEHTFFPPKTLKVASSVSASASASASVAFFGSVSPFVTSLPPSEEKRRFRFVPTFFALQPNDFFYEKKSLQSSNWLSMIQKNKQKCI